MEIDLTTSYVGILSLVVFVLAYAVVMAEEFSHLRKSKPVIISAAVISVSYTHLTLPTRS